MTDIDRLTQLLTTIETLREQLNKAVDSAHGNLQDPTVQKIADEFDRVLNEYMRLEKQK